MGQWGFGEFPWGLVYIVIDVDCFSRHSPQAKFGRPPFFVTKVLLKHSHTHLLSSHNHLLSTHLNYSEPAEPEIHTICLEKLCWNGSVALNCREKQSLVFVIVYSDTLKRHASFPRTGRHCPGTLTPSLRYPQAAWPTHLFFYQTSLL